jgi:hypothetical protein
MSNLSPAAQAVASAYDDTPEKAIGNHHYHWLAAALWAAADQADPKNHIKDIDYVHQSYVDGWKDALDLIFTIAHELEDQP